LSTKTTAKAQALTAESFVFSAYGDFGLGHLKGAKGGVAYVEYFDHPGPAGRHLFPVDLTELRRGILAAQTRIHTEIDGEWRQGRVVEHHADAGAVLVRLERREERVLPEGRIFVRWRRRVADATPFLASLAAESRRFYDGRSRFVHAYLSRATAYQQITALSSASVELHPHQMEAARRVLADATQRYLLADEVGLGKTIEAAIVVRQHLLDGSPGDVLVVVPSALTTQWKRELANKFGVAEQFAERVQIASFDEIGESGSLPVARNIGLLVVDEAHRVAAEVSTGPVEAQRYESLTTLSHSVQKVLLLSATPLLQEAASLLRLLHLLSPSSYPLDDAEGFEARLQSRDDVGRLYANLDADSPATFLRTAVGGLRDLLSTDAYALELLRSIDVELERGDADATRAAVRRARAYIGEAHRMYGRMIRTRRAAGLAEEFPVLGRTAPRVVEVGADLGVALALDAWRERLAAKGEASGEIAPGLLRVTRELLEGASGAGDALGEAVRTCLSGRYGFEPDPEERALLEELREESVRRAATCPRLTRAAELAASAADEGRKVAVAVGTEAAAAEVCHRIEAMVERAAVIRITETDPEAAERFAEANDGAVLVFGPVGEEGQNLQMTDLLIHADLPWSPNRVEQRLGRFDRFGAGVPAEQVVLVEGEAMSLGDAWFLCLRDGFEVFSGSIASLQLVVDAAVPDVVMAAVMSGAPGVEASSESIKQRLDEELQRIELAELLEETTADEQGVRLIDQTEEADGAAACQAWADAVVAWAAGDSSDAADLRFHHEEERNAHRFGLTRFDRPAVELLRASDLPLIPHDVLAARFAGAVDPNGRCEGTFRRLTAASREIRLLGPGDPFIEALWAFTEEDDRGRAFATWRARSAWQDRDDLLTFCFDLRVYPDISAAVETLPWETRESSEAALRRRAEGYLPPVHERVWLTRDLDEIREPALLALLDAPHSELHGDVTIRPWLWLHVDDFVQREAWAATCDGARERAVNIVAQRHGLTELCARAAELLRTEGEDAAARIRARADYSATERAEDEVKLVHALGVGVNAPKIDVDAAGVVILSAEPIPADELR
jgi:ATP-dependent helicase HepA